MTISCGLRAAAVAAAAGLAASPAGAQLVFTLQDHPGAMQAPPSYGLRLDNLFTAIGGPLGFTTFSFDHFANTTLTVGPGPNPTITIAGTVYGGVDDGSDYGFGEGAYALQFTYATGVSPSGSGWTASEAPSNSGSLTALADNNGVPMGTVFPLTDKNDPATSLSFLMLQDGHRLTPEQIQGMGDPWVGRGWLMTQGTTGGGTTDWLFVAVPAPGTALAACGLGVLGARRRRA
jgi:hypothetical protein